MPGLDRQIDLYYIVHSSTRSACLRIRKSKNRWLSRIKAPRNSCTAVNCSPWLRRYLNVDVAFERSNFEPSLQKRILAESPYMYQNEKYNRNVTICWIL